MIKVDKPRIIKTYKSVKEEEMEEETECHEYWQNSKHFVESELDLEFPVKFLDHYPIRDALG